MSLFLYGGVWGRVWGGFHLLTVLWDDRFWWLMMGGKAAVEGFMML